MYNVHYIKHEQYLHISKECSHVQIDIYLVEKACLDLIIKVNIICLYFLLCDSNIKIRYQYIFWQWNRINLYHHTEYKSLDIIKKKIKQVKSQKHT